jgi:hypothetical protein
VFTLCCEAEQVVDRLEGELGPDHVTWQRMQARRRYRERQHGAVTVGNMNVTACARMSSRRQQREAAFIERVPGIGDGDRLDHRRFRIAPQDIKV